LGRSVCT